MTVLGERLTRYLFRKTVRQVHVKIQTQRFLSSLTLGMAPTSAFEITRNRRQRSSIDPSNVSMLRIARDCSTGRAAVLPAALGDVAPMTRARTQIHFKTSPSSLPTFAPPDFVTKDVRTGTALATNSGLSPSFENALAAFASPLADPASCARPEVPTAPPRAGAALSSMSMPGTAADTCENSSGFRRDFATPNKAPAAPAAWGGVAPISFESAPTRSGLAFAAADAAAVAACASWPATELP